MMTKDEIVRMARDAGFEIACERVGGEDFIQVPLAEWDNSTHLFERFAAMVAAAEREACAMICEDLAKNPMTGVLHSWNCASVIRSRGDKN